MFADDLTYTPWAKPEFFTTKQRHEVPKLMRDYFCVRAPDRLWKLGEDLKHSLYQATKFQVSADFMDMSVANRNGGSRLVVAGQDFFNLRFDPMWLEWHSVRPEDKGIRYGALMFYPHGKEVTESNYGPHVNVILCMHRPQGVKDDYLTGGLDLVHLVFNPASFSYEDGQVWVQGQVLDGQDKEFISYAPLLADCIIRMNSPAVSEQKPCEDQTKLNRSREKKGKQPLFSYHILGLTEKLRRVHRELKVAGDEGAGVRFHKRSGHYKVCKTGIFWWTDHVVGRVDLGVVDKDYTVREVSNETH